MVSESTSTLEDIHKSIEEQGFTGERCTCKEEMEAELSILIWGIVATVGKAQQGRTAKTVEGAGSHGSESTRVRLK